MILGSDPGIPHDGYSVIRRPCGVVVPAIDPCPVRIVANLVHSILCGKAVADEPIVDRP